MTSPTQLKYLEAMGIPVWVSRDLIVEDEIVVPNVLPEKRSHNSAEDLIASLNAASQKPKQKATAPTTPPPVKKTHTDNNDKPASQAIHATTQHNQIGYTALHELYGEGSLEADWMVIGQSPDSNESKINQPYPYDSGDLLVNMLRAVGIEKPRTQAYLLNIVQTGNRVEETDASSAISELNKQLLTKIQEIQPKVLFIVGQLAAQNILNSKEPLARLRAQQKQQTFFVDKERVDGLTIPIVVTYYPAYLLSKPQDKAKVWSDLKRAMALALTANKA